MSEGVVFLNGKTTCVFGQLGRVNFSVSHRGLDVCKAASALTAEATMAPIAWAEATTPAIVSAMAAITPMNLRILSLRDWLLATWSRQRFNWA